MKKAKRIILLLALTLIMSLVFAACQTDTAVAPGAPKTLTAAAGDAQVVLSWGEADNNGSDITAYRVSWRKTSANTLIEWVDAESKTGHTATGLTNGDEYTFYVCAVSSAGAGEKATVTGTPFKVAEPVVTTPLSDEHKLVLTDAINGFLAQTNWQMQKKLTDENGETQTTVQKTGTAATFAGKNGGTFSAMTYDGDWYKIEYDSANKYKAHSLFVGQTAAEEDFDKATAAFVKPFLDAASTKFADCTVTTEDGAEVYAFTLNVTTPKGQENYNRLFEIEVTDGQLTRLYSKLTKIRRITGQEVGTTSEETEITYGSSSITMPLKWQDDVFGQNGWADKVTQLSSALTKIIAERDLWNSDAAKVFKLTRYGELSEMYKSTTGKGNFVLDQTKLTGDKLTTAWDTYKVNAFYETTGIDLYSEGLIEQMKANPQLAVIYPGFVDALEDALEAYGVANPPDSIVRTMLLSELDKMIPNSETNVQKTAHIMGAFGSAVITVRYGKVRQYGSTKIGYIDAAGDMPGVITAAQRTILENAFFAFDLSTNWKASEKETVGTNVKNLSISRTGLVTTNDFVAEFVASDGTTEYIAKNNDGYWYLFSWDSTDGFDVKEQCEYPISSFMGRNPWSYMLLNGYFGCELSNYEKETSAGVITETFTFEQADTGLYMRTNVVLKDGVIASIEKVNKVLDSATGNELSQSKTETTFEHGISAIDVPAGWAEYVVDFSGPAKTVGQLAKGIRTTIAGSGDWTCSDADALFRLQVFAEYSKYFKDDGTGTGKFVIDADNYDDPDMLEAMWDIYLTEMAYALFDINLYTVGLKAHLEEKLTDQAAFLLFLIPGTDDATVRTQFLTLLKNSHPSVQGQLPANPVNRGTLENRLTGAYIAVVDGVVTEYKYANGDNAVYAITYTP